MDTHPRSRAALIRGGVVLLLVFALLRWAGAVDLLSGLTKPIVIAVLGLFGAPAVDLGAGFTVGKLWVPWTRDCAGLNIFALLTMLSLWVNRAAPLGRRHLAQLALALPLAFLANLARIFSLIAYRAVFYPSVESAQLHYLIGFLWVLPVLPFLLRARGRSLEVLHLASALALLAPLAPAPGGSLVAVCALLVLVRARTSGRMPLIATGLWVAAALPIATTHMESLWLPWLLACPALVEWPRDWRAGIRLGLLVGTIPVLALHPAARWAGVLAALFAAWDLWRRPQSQASAQAEPGLGARESSSSGAFLPKAALAAMWIFPFAATSVRSADDGSYAPPRGVMSRVFEPRAYEVHLPGQAGDVDVLWFAPQGDGRHHTLPVCMRYRGVDLFPTDEAGVMTDGQGRWMREFFLQDGRLAEDYPTYLRRTFWPFSNTGVHVIVVGDARLRSAAAFKAASDDIAGRLTASGSR